MVVGLWTARSGRLKGEYVMTLVTVRATVTVMVKSRVGASGAVSIQKIKGASSITEPVTYSLLSPLTGRRVH